MTMRLALIFAVNSPWWVFFPNGFHSTNVLWSWVYRVCPDPAQLNQRRDGQNRFWSRQKPVSGSAQKRFSICKWQLWDWKKWFWFHQTPVLGSTKTALFECSKSVPDRTLSTVLITFFDNWGFTGFANWSIEKNYFAMLHPIVRKNSRNSGINAVKNTPTGADLRVPPPPRFSYIRERKVDQQC